MTSANKPGHASQSKRSPASATNWHDSAQTQLQMAIEINQALCDGVADIFSETLNFANQQMTASLDLCSQFGACRSADELIQLQLRLGPTALREYLKQYRRIAELATALHNSLLTRMENETSERGGGG
jgi:hypothetical protein